MGIPTKNRKFSQPQFVFDLTHLNQLHEMVPNIGMKLLDARDQFEQDVLILRVFDNGDYRFPAGKDTKAARVLALPYQVG